MMRARRFAIAAALLFLNSGASAQDAPRSAASIECSRQADERGLHGEERKSFRAQCKASFGQQPNAAALSLPPGQSAPGADGASDEEQDAQTRK
jgi:hypothetical protein